MAGEICPISLGGGEEVAMFGGVVEGCDGGSYTTYLFVHMFCILA
jgi:hypothetical protein